MAELGQPVVGFSEGKYCPDCGYDLRGIASERCPECGIALGAAASFTIPWAHRAEVGRLRALRRTLWMGTFQADRLARAAARPVDPSSANRFRWTVFAIAAVPAIALIAIFYAYEGGSGFLNLIEVSPRGAFPVGPLWELKMIWSAGATLIPVIPIGIALTILLWTIPGGYWFYVPGLEPVRLDRAVVLSRYCIAPLAWIAICEAFLAATIGLQAAGLVYLFHEGWLVLLCLAALAMGIATIGTWGTTLRVLSRTTQCTGLRLIIAAIGLPLTWAAAAVIGVGVFPCVVGLAWIAIDGLR